MLSQTWAKPSPWSGTYNWLIVVGCLFCLPSLYTENDLKCWQGLLGFDICCVGSL